MDSNLIYTKTAAGEEAIQQKARVMQRNLRMVLILVDGKSTVADLSLKIGNALLTENALAELESTGLVAPRVEQDSSWFEGKKDRRRQVEPNEGGDSGGRQSGGGRSRDSIFGSERSLDSVHSAFDDSAFGNSVIPLSGFGNAKNRAESPMPGEDRNSKFSRTFATAIQGVRSFLDRGRRLFARSGVGEESPVSVTIKPIRREARPPRVIWPVRVLIGLCVLILLVAVGVVLFPYGVFKTEIEAAFTRAVGTPVAIESVSGQVYPQPGFFLQGVKIGRDGKALNVPEVRLLPSLASLFSDRMVFQRVVVSGLRLPVESVAVLPTYFGSLNAPSSRFSATNVVFESMTLDFGGLSLDGLTGNAGLGVDGVFKVLHLTNSSGSLTIDAALEGRGVRISAAGLGWRPDEKSLYQFDSLNISGKVENAGMVVDAIDLRVLGGVVKGSAVVGSGSNPSLQGNLVFERIDSKRLANALGIAEILIGEVSGRLSFAADSKDWSSLVEVLTVDGEVSVGRGKLVGIDLPEAVRRHSATPVRGGETPFEQLSAKVRGTPSSIVLSGITMASGLMQSAGSVEVKKDLSIEGSIQLVLRGSVNQMRVPMALDGTLGAPTVRVDGKN